MRFPTIIYNNFCVCLWFCQMVIRKAFRQSLKDQLHETKRLSYILNTVKNLNEIHIHPMKHLGLKVHDTL